MSLAYIKTIDQLNKEASQIIHNGDKVMCKMNGKPVQYTRVFLNGSDEPTFVQTPIKPWQR